MGGVSLEIFEFILQKLEAMKSQAKTALNNATCVISGVFSMIVRA